MTPASFGYRIIAYVSLALAVAGIALPLLPTTPFVLLAAWAAGRASPEFRHWLHNHKTFGPIIENWQQGYIVPLRAKWTAFVMLMISWGVLFASGAATLMLIGLGFCFCCLLTFLFSRPSR